MTVDSVECVYCGNATTDWDHFRPLVKAARPTGFGHSVGNLVPSCGPCNQSKGGQNWRQWMLGHSRNSPTSRNVADIAKRIQALETYEIWSAVVPTQFAAMLPADVWTRYWARLDAIKAQLAEAQRDADFIRSEIASAVAQRSSS